MSNVIYVDFKAQAMNTPHPKTSIIVGPIFSLINGQQVYTADKTIAQIHDIARSFALGVPLLENHS